jgi:hypothetical protein
MKPTLKTYNQKTGVVFTVFIFKTLKPQISYSWWFGSIKMHSKTHHHHSAMSVQTRNQLATTIIICILLVGGALCFPLMRAADSAATGARRGPGQHAR